MINLNASKSSGSGKSVLHVLGKLKSFMSATRIIVDCLCEENDFFLFFILLDHIRTHSLCDYLFVF